MKIKVMGNSVTGKTVSQDTVSGEVEKPIPNNIPEIAKKVPRVTSKDKEQIDDKGIRKPNYHVGSNKERETNIERMGKDLKQVKEVYFDFI